MHGRRTIFRGGTGAVSFGDTLGDHVVPLLLCLAVKQTNDHHGHVVASNATGFTVGSKAIVHHVLTDAVQFLLSRDTSSDELDNSLRRLAIPNT